MKAVFEITKRHKKNYMQGKHEYKLKKLYICMYIHVYVHLHTCIYVYICMYVIQLQTIKNSLNSQSIKRRQ